MLDYNQPPKFPLEQDDVFEKAVELVAQTGKASASLFQRHLKLGYARAARLLDQLEEKGIVGPGEGAKPREILISHVDEDGEMVNPPPRPAKVLPAHDVEPLVWKKTAYASHQGEGLRLDIGKDKDGQSISFDLTRYGGLLVVGSQYTSALDFVNGVLALSCAQFVPDELRMLVIDPVRDELVVPRRSPHLLVPVVCDQDRIESALAWLQGEIERRRADEDLVVHPNILLVINGLNILLDGASALIEARLYNILLQGRKAGVFVLATLDSPGSGALKRVMANIPAKLVFKPTDPRGVRDTGILESLLLESPEEAILETMWEGRTKVTINEPDPRKVYEQIYE